MNRRKFIWRYGQEGNICLKNKLKNMKNKMKNKMKTKADDTIDHKDRSQTSTK